MPTLVLYLLAGFAIILLVAFPVITACMIGAGVIGYAAYETYMEGH